MALVLSPEKEGAMVRQLAYKTSMEVGLEFGLDKHYSDLKGVRNKVQNVYRKVMANPDKYGLGPEIIKMIADGLKSRQLGFSPSAKRLEPSLAEQKIDSRDIKDLATSIRDKSFKLIDRKLDRLSNSKKRLDAISFKELGVIAGISFDKTQILKGEATENIAVLGKIEGNLTPQEMIKAVLEHREELVASKHES